MPDPGENQQPQEEEEGEAGATGEEETTPPEDAVTEDETDIESAAAASEDKGTSSFSSWRAAQIGLAVCIVLLVGAIVGISVALAKDGSSDNGSGSGGGSGGAGTDAPADALALFLEERSGAVPADGTAQGDAYGWLLENGFGVGGTPEEDEAVWETFVLVTLYYATDGSNWSSNDGWLDPSVPVCGWHPGNICEAPPAAAFQRRSLQETPDRVRTLALDDLNLQGSLPGEVFLLDALEEFNIRSNPGLIGSLPSTMREASNLRGFLAGNTGFNGTFPENLNRMSSLERFEMAGATGMAGAPYPQELWLANPGVLTLDLQGIGLTGTLRASPGGPLVILLQNNNLGGEFPNPDRPIYQDVEAIDLRNNSLTGTIPSGIERLWRQGLLQLRLEGNNITGDVTPASCDAFENTYSTNVDSDDTEVVFSSDCIDVFSLDCPCCTLCCFEGANCQERFPFLAS